jgi:hypothetical protein
MTIRLFVNARRRAPAFMVSHQSRLSLRKYGNDASASQNAACAAENAM